MTLDDLIDWVDDAMVRLPLGHSVRPGIKHVRRLYRVLDKKGSEWELREPWHALAAKVAKLLGERVPEKAAEPSPQPGKRTPRHPAGSGQKPAK
ncbi:MAG: hypothetical protein ACRD3J_29690, partial [Thermoanaerobaculia bacterium]